eukprot:184862-Alexandrium_andersonii.AAC.1
MGSQNDVTLTATIEVIIISLPGGATAPPWTTREAPPACPPAYFVGGFGICAENGAERTEATPVARLPT